MPRSRCHFCLLQRLHERFRHDLPDIADLADRELATYYAGSVAPDAVRYYSDLGKYGTHFYEEDRKETWGCAVSGMFEAHPGLSDPGALSESQIALILGYISHLTVDEAFRDVVTHQLHGVENWRPATKGLWSLVDELELEAEGLSDTLASYRGTEDVGFILGAMVFGYVEMVGPWAETADPWEAEKMFLRLIGDETPESDAKESWSANRERALPLLDDTRRQTFVETAVQSGYEEVKAFVNGGYSKMPCA